METNKSISAHIENLAELRGIIDNAMVMSAYASKKEITCDDEATKYMLKNGADSVDMLNHYLDWAGDLGDLQNEKNTQSIIEGYFDTMCEEYYLDR